MQELALTYKHLQSPRIVILKAVCRFFVLLLRTFSGFPFLPRVFLLPSATLSNYCVVPLNAPLSD